MNYYQLQNKIDKENLYVKILNGMYGHLHELKLAYLFLRDRLNENNYHEILYTLVMKAKNDPYFLHISC